MQNNNFQGSYVDDMKGYRIHPLLDANGRCTMCAFKPNVCLTTRGTHKLRVVVFDGTCTSYSSKNMVYCVVFLTFSVTPTCSRLLLSCLVFGLRSGVFLAFPLPSTSVLHSIVFRVKHSVPFFFFSSFLLQSCSIYISQAGEINVCAASLART